MMGRRSGWSYGTTSQAMLVCLLLAVACTLGAAQDQQQANSPAGTAAVGTAPSDSAVAETAIAKQQQVQAAVSDPQATMQEQQQAQDASTARELITADAAETDDEQAEGVDSNLRQRKPKCQGHGANGTLANGKPANCQKKNGQNKNGQNKNGQNKNGQNKNGQNKNAVNKTGQNKNVQNKNGQSKGSNQQQAPKQNNQQKLQQQYLQQQQPQQQRQAEAMRTAQAVGAASIPAEAPVTLPAETPVVPAAPVVNFPPPPMPARASQLSPSVLLMGYFDWQNIPDANGKPWSRCLDMVWRARRLSRGNKLNFIPTHHWMPGTDGFGVSKFCYMYKDSNNNMVCGDWTLQKIQEFEDSMTQCLIETFRNGFTPYIRPHLDDGYARGIWRNGLLFNPVTPYGPFSYKQIMLDPLARAMKRALQTTAAEGTLWPEQDKARPRVYFGLQGEMCATIMRYTSDWMSTIPSLRAIMGSDLADIKFGIGLNFNALDQTEYSVAPNTGFGWMFGAQRSDRYAPSIDAAAIYNMVTNTIDFIGISAYAPYTGPGMGLNEFENSAFNVGESLRSLGGVDLTALINSGKVELHYSEFGIGGGNEGNAQPASSAYLAGKMPWAGVAGFYSSYRNPWNRADLQAYRTEFYSKTLQWLSQPDSKTYKVCDVFVWGMASWDLFGIYPDSTTYEGSYRDGNMVKAIAAHNKLVIVAQVYATKDPAAAQLVQQQLDAQDGQFAYVFQESQRVAAPAAVQARNPAPVQQRQQQQRQQQQRQQQQGWGWLFGRH